MRADRPLIGAVASLASGVGLIVAYCQGSTSMNAAYPFSGSTLHMDLTTTGPGVLGGLGLIALGLLLLVWALVAAIVSQVILLSGGRDRMDSLLDRERGDPYDDDRYSGSLGMTQHRHES